MSGALVLKPPPSLVRDFLFRLRINHTIKEPITRTAIPTVTPTMVGTFEVDADDRSEAGIDVNAPEDRDDGADGDIVGA